MIRSGFFITRNLLLFSIHMFYICLCYAFGQKSEHSAIPVPCLLINCFQEIEYFPSVASPNKDSLKRIHMKEFLILFCYAMLGSLI